MRTSKLTRATLAAVASVVALAPLTGCSASDPTPTSPATSSPLRPSGSATSPSVYEDGTYSASGEYGSAPSYLDVTLTLDDNKVTRVTVTPNAENETSRGYQERFAAAVPDEVVGKSLNEVKVGKLAGASLCADGFNAAIAQIRDEASANS